jgi:hypothetical protein
MMGLRRSSIATVLRSFPLVLLIAAATHLPAMAQSPDIGALQKAAKEGNADAQYQLADAYLEGKGTPINAKQGVEWLEKAAKLDHPGAQLMLAKLLLVGTTNVSKDSKQGLEWLRKSADHGYAPAQYSLGRLYQDGDAETGTARSPHEAAKLFRAAARQPGSTKSQTALQEMFEKKLISKQEANWRAPEPAKVAEKGKPAPFSLAEVETGLKGSITKTRMATLVQTYGVNFKLNAAARQRLQGEGADEYLLQIISASKRS